MVAQAFQPVQTQAKACDYKKCLFNRNSVLKVNVGGHCLSVTTEL
jgi:hypothetical protein